MLLVDKPSGASSNRVLQQVRRSLDARKAGHAGTLDPLATGMLPVLLGEATKLAGFLIDADKAYDTTLRLGVETDSLDADGSPVRTRPVPGDLTLADVERAAATLRGQQWQTPPMVSAVRVNGERLYEAAREGREVERAARCITVHALQVRSLDGDRLRLSVRCSKGTYIRVLGAELGELLGCGAHVETLRRTWVAPFQDAPMFTPDAISAQGDGCVLPMDAGLGHLPRVSVDGAGLQSLAHGQEAAAVGAPQPGDGSGATDAAVYRVYAPHGGLVALGTLTPEGRIQPTRVLQLAPDRASGSGPAG